MNYDVSYRMNLIELIKRQVTLFVDSDLLIVHSKMKRTKRKGTVEIKIGI